MNGAYEVVRLARANDRPSGGDYISSIVTDFMEFHGDRRFADDPAIIGGIGRIRGRAVTVIATDKGKTTPERLRRSFGSPNPEGYRKALRLAQQAEKFHRPVLCIVDTSGARCGVGAEERGQGQAIAECLTAFSALRVPVLTLLVGEGGSGGALALAVADEVWMLENAVYSVISPEGCASILWKDASRAPDAAENLCLTAQDALGLKVADRVLPETDIGTSAFYANLSIMIDRKLSELIALPVSQLLSARFMRFRAFTPITETEDQP